MLDCDSGELRKGNQKVALRPKCFDLLLYLLQRPRKLVSKDELLDQLWSDAVVTEATLSRTIGSLREALEDHPDNPTYIETVSRRGYKFIGPVEEVRTSEKPPDLMLVLGKKEYPLRTGAQTIGRGRDVDIAVYSATTSRHHARITLAGGAVTLQDLDSRHGTFVNGQRVSGEVRLEPGDEIDIGGKLLALWSPAGPTSPR